MRHSWLEWRGSSWLLVGRHRSAPASPQGRPIELIAEDLRRLGHRYHHPPPGVAFVKLEGIRRAYDQALADACACLDIDHLLLVLAPGTELEQERRRVEDALWLAGLRLPGAA